jgi:hypothetical protein
MGLPMAATVERRGDQIQALVAGLYVSPDLMGVATHGGERTHAHWVAPDLESTAHLDRWGLKTGQFSLCQSDSRLTAAIVSPATASGPSATAASMPIRPHAGPFFTRQA